MTQNGSNWMSKIAANGTPNKHIKPELIKPETTKIHFFFWNILAQFPYRNSRDRPILVKVATPQLALYYRL